MNKKISVKARLTKREVLIRETLEEAVNSSYCSNLLELLVEKSSKGVLSQLIKFNKELQAELGDRIRLIQSLEGEPNENLTDARSRLESLTERLEEWHKLCTKK